MTIAKPGNPHGSPRETLYKVTVKLDEETLGMLAELETKHGPNIRGRRSSVLREAIRDKHGRSRK
jgi:hypothetical protein